MNDFVPPFADWLQLPTTAITYHVSDVLRRVYTDLALVEANASSFDLLGFADAGHCVLSPKTESHREITTSWQGPGGGLSRELLNGCFEAVWQENTITVVYLSWPGDYGRKEYCFLLASTREMAEQFFEAVCEWGAEIRGEVLVFEDGCWSKNAELFEAIQNSRFENLILSGTLKQELREDFARFFASRAAYERYNIPWKRGVLLVGPPGNGKTHTVKALVNTCGVPCLYVKSFKSEYGTDQDNIRKVFKRARQTTPCLLILEDLDALITDENRAFFLNELDGFAENTGIVTVASTNHPERLDGAITNRPSRFDRKYHFTLPALEEREQYVALWNGGLAPELRVSKTDLQVLAEETDGFSFAYLKELFVSSLTQWVSANAAGENEAFAHVLHEQARLLREQMRAAGALSANQNQGTG